MNMAFARAAADPEKCETVYDNAPHREEFVTASANSGSLASDDNFEAVDDIVERITELSHRAASF